MPPKAPCTCFFNSRWKEVLPFWPLAKCILRKFHFTACARCEDTFYYGTEMVRASLTMKDKEKNGIKIQYKGRSKIIALNRSLYGLCHTQKSSFEVFGLTERLKCTVFWAHGRNHFLLASLDESEVRAQIWNRWISTVYISAKPW